VLFCSQQDFSVFTTVNINSANSNTVTKWWKTETFKWVCAVFYLWVCYAFELIQDAQLSQRDRAAGCVIVIAKSRTLELGDNDLRTL